MNPNYPLVAERASHRCEYCHAPEVVFNFSFEVEHIVPSIKGGSDNELNYALACRSCNLFKSDSVEGLDRETNKRFELFNPRNNAWDEHFVLNRDTAELIGLNEIGRATIQQLRLNRPNQLLARRQWMRLGLFP